MYLLDGVHASSLTFSAFLRASVLGSRDRNAIVLPSLDHSNDDTPPDAEVSVHASPPSGRISQICRLPSSSAASLGSLGALGRGRSDRNASVLPSGDQRGNSSAWS